MNGRNERKGYLMIFLAGALWGNIGLFVKLLIGAGADSGLISCMRMVSAFFLIFVIGIALEGKRVLKIRRRTFVFCLIMGLFCQCVYNLAYTQAIDRVGMAVGAVLLYTSPVFTCIFSRVLFKEGITKMKLAALAVNILGCTLAVTGGSFGGGTLSLYGLALGMLAALMYALSPVFGRYAAAEEGPFTIAIYMFFFAAVFTVIFSRPWESGGAINGTVLLLGLMYGLIPTVMAYILYFKGLNRVTETSKVPVFSSVETVVAALIGVLFFSEDFNLWKGAGIGLVLLSIFIMNRRTKKEEIPESSGNVGA